MKPSMAIVGILTMLLSGCGSGNGGGDCPDVTGTWEITEHCDPDAVGTTSVVTQDGCNITTVWNGTVTFTGTVDTNGNTSISGNPGGGTLTCSGPVSGNTWTMDCTPETCHLVSQKQQV